jgi:hypothetical protein
MPRHTSSIFASSCGIQPSIRSRIEDEFSIHTFIMPNTAHNLFSCVPPTCFNCYFQPSSGSQHQMVHTAAVYHEWHVIHSLLHCYVPFMIDRCCVNHLMLTLWRRLEVTVETCRGNTREEIGRSIWHNKSVYCKILHGECLILRMFNLRSWLLLFRSKSRVCLLIKRWFHLYGKFGANRANSKLFVMFIISHISRYIF